MKVRAIARGFYGNTIREEDDVFDVAEGSKASWFIPLKDAKKINQEVDEDEAPATPEDAKKLTNPQLQKLLSDEGIKAPEGATKAEMIKLYFDGVKKAEAKKAEDELV